MDIGEMKQHTEQLMAQVLELAAAVNDIPSGPDAEAKRQQLRAICGSIRQLETRDVPVPDDLRRIKTNLASSLAAEDEAQQVKKLLRERLLSALNLLGVSVQSNAGVRPTHQKRIGLSDLMDAGLLKDGTRIVHRAKRSGKVYHGYIRNPGVVEITIDGTKQTFGTPSAAGQALAKGAVDGWNYWSVVNENGDDEPLCVCRDRYIKEAKP